MHPRNDYLLEWKPVWTPVNLDDDDDGDASRCTTATGGKSYALQLERDGEPYYGFSRADLDKLNEFVDRWYASKKKEASVKKEVNVDAWKEVFATSAAGS
jgi:hypothetical protein